MRLSIAICSICISLFAASTVSADDAGVTFFEKKIRPVLAKHCYRCHSSEKRQRGKLAVDTRDAIRKGGETGPAVVPGKLDASLLIKAIRYNHVELQMPPNGKLPKHVVADLEKWVAMGAPDPRSGKAPVAKAKSMDIEEGRKFWAFQPPTKREPPGVKDGKWTRGAVDRFILSKLENKGLTPWKDADKVTLIRRAYLALIGLPPTPKQIDDFVKDNSKQAFLKVVDELLASPHFGERWGRHWLDVARFAQSTGGGRSLLLPLAWRYRDYVIRSFNADKPYNRFIMEQIAGDLLSSKDQDERFWQLIATAYLLLGPTNYELQDKPVLESDVIDEQLDTIGRSMLGMTIGCARCHDHKFDPIPAKDYYALAGIFKSTKSLVHSNVSKWMEMPLPMPPQLADAVTKHNAAVAALEAKIKLANAELKATGVVAALGPLAVKDIGGIVVDDADAKRIGRWVTSKYKNTFIGQGYLYDDRSSNAEKTLTFNPEIPKDGFYEVRLAYLAGPNRATNTPIRIFHTDGEKTIRINQREPANVDGRFHSLGKYRFEKGDQWFVMISTKGTKDGVVVADAVQFIHEDDLDESPDANNPANKKKLKFDLASLQRQLKKLKASAPERPMAMAVTDAAKISDFYIAIRGVIHNKGPVVKRGFLQVATYGETSELSNKESGRRELAEWLASPKNPLTARVMVNRIWHHLFGFGIVRSTDNFGKTGSLPSHPELLDYLAVRFVEQGWSVKKLIREIMLSHTYQLSSMVDANDPAVQKAIKADPENRLLWRHHRRRVDAEVIRDTMLFVAGTLGKTAGGPNVGKGTVIERGYAFKDTQRSVYTPVFRNQLHPLFAVFDFPDPNLVLGARASSTVAPQALYLLNSPFVLEQAKEAAVRLLEQSGKSQTQRIESAYRTTLGRLPTKRETEIAIRFLGESNDAADWQQFYQVLFSSIDFRYVN